jgi:hypothetical protein
MRVSNCLQVNIHQTYKYIEEYAYIYAFILNMHEKMNIHKNMHVCMYIQVNT